jgi:hypothetical protein
VTILGCIVRELFYLLRLQNDSPMAQTLKLLYKLCGAKPHDVDNLRSRFETLVQYFTQVYVIIDGFEQCSARGPAGFTSETFFYLAKGNVNVMMSSLGSHQNPLIFPGLIALPIPVQSVQRDISTYIDYRLLSDYRFRKITGDLRQEIKDKVLERSFSRYFV